MLNQFLLENIRFSLDLLAALVFFAVFWLYFDAWTNKKHFKELPKILGFILLSFSFLAQAVFVESAIFENLILGAALQEELVLILRSSGYGFIILSQLIDPIQPHPRYQKSHILVPLVNLPLKITGFFALPLGSALAGLLYLKRATLGFENHLKPVALSFLTLSFYELASLAKLFRDSSNIQIFELTKAFGPVWILTQVILLLVILILGRWVFGYLLKRLQTQLFMLFTLFIVSVFLITTVTFTYLILRNLTSEALRQLEVDVKVLNYSIESKKSEVLSDASVLAQNQEVINAISEGKRIELFGIAQNYLLSKKESFLVITDPSGQVLARGEDKERYGDSLSGDALIKRAGLGENAVSVDSKEGVIAPEVSLRAAVPVKSSGKVIGMVLIGTQIDNAFVDGLKSATGLEAAVYGNNQVSSTTVVSTDGKSRLLGIKEENSQVKDKVLSKGENLTLGLNILNLPYFGAFLPLKDVNNTTVGMLFVGKPQVGVLQAAGRSIQATFIVTVLLLIISILPSYLISRFLSKQLE